MSSLLKVFGILIIIIGVIASLIYLSTIEKPNDSTNKKLEYAKESLERAELLKSIYEKKLLIDPLDMQSLTALNDACTDLVEHSNTIAKYSTIVSTWRIAVEFTIIAVTTSFVFGLTLYWMGAIAGHLVSIKKLLTKSISLTKSTAKE